MENSTKRILLIDTSAILHIVKHSGIKNLKAKDRENYIIFGFLLKLRFLMQKTNPTYCVFALDSPPHFSLRTKLFPEYKARRSEKTQEEIDLDELAFPQFGAVTEKILPKIGYKNVFRENGYEADDIIGSICKKYKDHEIIIVTTDKDIYQLLTPKVCILNAKTTQYYTYKNFQEEFNVEPKMWKRIKSIGGCNSDKVPGISGVAEKTVIKFLKGKLSPNLKTYKDITSEEGRKIINRNKALVILPFRGTPEYNLQRDSLSKDGLKETALQYELTSLGSDISNWFKVLNAGNPSKWGNY